jgi:hypothetical protein
MTQERAERFRSASDPRERAGIVMEHLNSPSQLPSGSLSYREGWGGTTGQHWSNTYGVARGFSRPNPATQKQLHEASLPEDVPVVLHAELPTQAQRYTSRGQRNANAGHPSEDEVTLKASAPVRLKAITFPGLGEFGRPDTDRSPETVPVRAKLRAGRSMV